MKKSRFSEQQIAFILKQGDFDRNPDAADKLVPVLEAVGIR